MSKIARFAITLVAALLSVSGCAPAKAPFVTVQFCVRNRAGMAQLIANLKEIANANHMDFADSSAYTEKDLAAVGYRGRERRDGSPVLSVGLLGKDGLFVGGGNLGLPGYQVQLGFTKGSDDAEAHRFAAQVISQLRQQWQQLNILPRGAAAKPMADCR
ncbi:MAG TPA: hypothetical protein VIY50_11575 [Steroidobacteraceae bacterium]